MNDLLGSWEEAGVESFIILTADGHDPHQEALSTLRTRQARVFTVDVFALDFSDDLEDADGPMHGSELDTSLLLYLAPELVRMERAQDFVLPEKQRTRYLRTSAGSLPKRSPGSLGRPSIATREKGERLYKMIYDRVATRVLGVPVPCPPSCWRWSRSRPRWTRARWSFGRTRSRSRVRRSASRQCAPAPVGPAGRSRPRSATTAPARW